MMDVSSQRLQTGKRLFFTSPPQGPRIEKQDNLYLIKIDSGQVVSDAISLQQSESACTVTFCETEQKAIQLGGFTIQQTERIQKELQIPVPEGWRFQSSHLNNATLILAFTDTATITHHNK